MDELVIFTAGPELQLRPSCKTYCVNPTLKRNHTPKTNVQTSIDEWTVQKSDLENDIGTIGWVDGSLTNKFEFTRYNRIEFIICTKGPSKGFR